MTYQENRGHPIAMPRDSPGVACSECGADLHDAQRLTCSGRCRNIRGRRRAKQ